MSDVKAMARAMAQTAINEGQKIAFDSAISLCNKIADALEAKGHRVEAMGARACLTVIMQMKADINGRDAAGGRNREE